MAKSKVLINKCENCGEEYIPVRPGMQKYCSHKCRTRHATLRYRQQQKRTMSCKMCGTKYRTTSTAEVGLCKSCREEMKGRERKKESNAEAPVCDRDKELKMIKDWLKKNKPTIVGSNNTSSDGILVKSSVVNIF